MTTALALGALSRGALFPEPGPAHDWLRHELDGAEYRPSLVERFWHAVQDVFDRVRDATVGAGGFDPVVAVVVLVLLVVLAAFVLSRLRANPSAAGADRAVFGGSRMSAADHRALAAGALDRADWGSAIVESTRALAAGLFERGLVIEDTGATADEIAARAAQVFPAFRERLQRAALVFDETMYGDRTADAARAREVLDLEQQLRSAAPDNGSRRSPVAAVPR
jgi:hypothetical protein